MRTRHMRRTGTKPGVALLIALIFLILFSCMAVAIATSADSNLTVARNRLTSQRASALAETGVQLAQVNLATGLSVPSSGDAAPLYAAIANKLTSAWSGSHMVDTRNIHTDASGVEGITVSLAGGDGVLPGTIEMKIYVSSDDPKKDTTLTIASTGTCGNASRTVYYNLTVQKGASALSLYGVSSKSPVTFLGITSLRGAVDSKGAAHPENGNILSASYSTTTPVSMIGICSTSGDVAICNPKGDISKMGICTVGGQVIKGAPEPQWPEVDVSVFKPYATNTYSGNGLGDITLSNVRIPANTNPTFFGNVRAYGVIYVEAPNRVSFLGNTTVCGVIACETPKVDSLTANQINVLGNLNVSSIDNLPAEPQYEGIRTQTGSFLLAPGYSTTFAGNFHTVSGCMVASQFAFIGNAIGTVSGGICNLRDSSFLIAGYANIAIDREKAVNNPAGIVSSGVLKCVPGSYAE